MRDTWQFRKIDAGRDRQFPFVTLSAGKAQTANRVPRFDIAHACRTMAVLPDIEHGQNRDDDVKHCVETEFQARKQLETEWSRFTEIARTTCLGISSVGSVNPVYSELMACLDELFTTPVMPMGISETAKQARVFIARVDQLLRPKGD